MLPSFRHTLRMKARWAPNFVGDDRSATAEDEAAIDVDGDPAEGMYVGAVFEVSTV